MEIYKDSAITLQCPKVVAYSSNVAGFSFPRNYNVAPVCSHISLRQKQYPGQCTIAANQEQHNYFPNS